MEKIKIEVSNDIDNNLDTCHQWWKNFVRSMVVNNKFKPGTDEWTQFRDEYFKDNKITYVEHDEIYCDSEKDFTWFLLKWA